jgi:glucose-6-phosphate isomerase
MLESRAEIVAPAFTAGAVEVREQNLNLAGAASVADALKVFLRTLDTDSGYVSIHAYLDRESAASAQGLRERFAIVTRRPVTFGWGPRFLHSTGQYHKGGPKQGVFLQIVAESATDLPVPGRNFSFGELIASQAAGDASVLAALGRPVLTLTLKDVEAGLAAIAAAV